MFACQRPVLGVIAFQLAAALDEYERDVARLVRGPLDLVLYDRVSRQMDQMRQYAAALPPLSVAWVEVMIRHFELMHGLWRLQGGEPPGSGLASLHARLRAAVRHLSGECTALMPAA